MARFVAERPLRLLEGLFRPCGELGWPAGVQEDYDVHWQVDEVAPAKGPLAESVSLWDVDPMPATADRLEMERVNPHMRCGPPDRRPQGSAERQAT